MPRAPVALHLLTAFAVSACSGREARDAGAPAPEAASPAKDAGARAAQPDGPVGPVTGLASTAACPGKQPSARDGDADGISDTIEADNARLGQAHLRTGRCDADPSRSVGKPFGGSLPEGVNLPDNGEGYKHSPGGDPVDSDDWSVLAMVQCVEAVGQRLRPQGRELGVTNLSKRGGGRFVPHKSHQNGVDADMRYPRLDKKNLPLDLKRDPDRYNRDATLALFKLFGEICKVDVIFADLTRVGFDDGDVPGVRIAHVAGHSNHFHLRLAPEVTP